MGQLLGAQLRAHTWLQRLLGQSQAERLRSRGRGGGHSDFLLTPQKIICARCSEDCGGEQAAHLSQSRSESLVKQKGKRQQGRNEWERYLRVEKLHGALGWLKQAEMLATATCDTLSSVLGLTQRKRRTDTNELPSDLSLACVCAHINK